MSKELWEVLVPTIHRLNGNPIRVRFHRVWDAKVRALCGGLTITSPVKGEWISPEGDLYRDRMIPVRIVATRPEIEAIIAMTLKYYQEKAVLAYKLSEEVIILHETEN